MATGADGAVYAGGAGGLLAALTAEGELLWRNEAVEGAPQIVILDVSADGAIAALADFPPTLLAYAAGGEPTLAERLYELDATSYPAAMPGGALAQVHQGRLEVYTSDPALAVETAAPAPPPADRAAAEAEIAGFMVDLIVEEDIEATLQYIEESDWQGGEGPTENLIVWTTQLPVEEAADQTLTVMTWDESTQSYLQEERPIREEDNLGSPKPRLDEENPLKVWTYNQEGLVEVAGDTAAKLAAIAAYEEKHITMDEGPDIFAWGAYDFAITSVDESLRKAEVYRAASCGRLCGSGYLLTLERKPDGAWTITDAEHLWQS